MMEIRGWISVFAGNRKNMLWERVNAFSIISESLGSKLYGWSDSILWYERPGHGGAKYTASTLQESLKKSAQFTLMLFMS